MVETYDTTLTNNISTIVFKNGVKEMKNLLKDAHKDTFIAVDLQPHSHGTTYTEIYLRHPTV